MPKEDFLADMKLYFGLQSLKTTFLTLMQLEFLKNTPVRNTLKDPKRENYPVILLVRTLLMYGKSQM